MTDTKRNFDKDAALWDENPGRVKMAKEIFDTIASEINPAPSMDVLDFGCGTGLLTMQMAPFVRSITGIDTSQGMLDVLNAKISDRNLTHIKTRFVDLEKGGSLEGRYHLITSSMTFHHLKNIRLVLDQFYNVLHPAGKICIADLDSDDGEFHENNDGVFHFGFERDDLSRMMQEAGFKDIKCLTGARITKPISGGTVRVFTIFLMTGCKL
jgi:ubiquinone/menaquinone biosynthesis C-methylase UbiE